MGLCTDCQKTWGVCDCCKLLFADENMKQVTHCKLCNANICQRCEENWALRGAAYFKTKGIQIANWVKSFFS